MRSEIAFPGPNPWGTEANSSVIFGKSRKQCLCWFHFILLTYAGENAIIRVIIIIIDTLD